jgi:O-antigen biosynthesis protein
MKKSEGFNWVATADDPQIHIAPPRAEAIVYILLDRRGGHFLSPELFVSWDDGFKEFAKFTPSPASCILLKVRFQDTRGLRALRLDPHHSVAEFLLRSETTRENEGPPTWMTTHVKQAELNGIATSFMEIDPLEFAPPDRGRPIGQKRRPRNTHEHFLLTVEMARRAVMASQSSISRNNRSPLISFIVPTFNTKAEYLDDLLASFRRQTSGLAELVLSDDGSSSSETIRWLNSHRAEADLAIHLGDQNRGIAIATNMGIEKARGKWIGLVDHDDALAPFAVDMIALTLSKYPNVQFLYTDEMIADQTLIGVEYFHKPAFDPVLLSGINYINHLSIYRRDRLIEIGALKTGFDGSQDYDLVLRYTQGLKSSEILHLPYPAYLWRRHGEAYSAKFMERAIMSARKALAEAYAVGVIRPTIVAGLSKNVHRVRLTTAEATTVSIVIPNKDSYPLIKRVMDGLARTSHRYAEVIIVDNGTTDEKTLSYYNALQSADCRVVVDRKVESFNFSRQINRGVRLARGSAVLMLNNDVEIVDGEWLSEMVECLAYRDVGIVGARLLYPDKSIQHAGVVVGLGELAGHWYTRKPSDITGPMARLHVRNSMTAVTGACMLISRDCLNSVGSFDENNFAIAYNDVDYCLRAIQGGFRVVYTPFATLIHHESLSRGSDETVKTRPRFLREQAALLEIHGTATYQDRAYSPWYDRGHSEPTVILPDELPLPR